MHERQKPPQKEDGALDQSEGAGYSAPQIDARPPDRCSDSGAGGAAEKREKLDKLYRQLRPELERSARRRIFRTGRGQDAADLVNDVFTSLATRPPYLPDIDKPDRYLKKSLTHAISAFNQASAAERENEVRLDQPPAGNRGATPVELGDHEQLDAVLHEAITVEDLQGAIEKLEPLERAFIEMELGGMSSRRIAIELGIKADRAERIMTKTHRRLETLLSDVIHGRVR